MKKLFIFQILILLSTIVWADDKSTFISALNNAKWTYTDGNKAGFTTLTFIADQNPLFGNSQSITIAKYNSKAYTTSLLTNEGYKKACKTSVAANAIHASYAINCSYFDNSGPGSVNFQRTAVPMWSDNTEYNYNKYMYINPSEDKLNFNRCSGLVGFKSDGTIEIKAFESAKMIEAGYYDNWEDAYTQFVVSGPLLRVKNANVDMAKGYNPWFEASNPRSIIGKDKKGYVYMIVIDGRKCDAVKSVGTTIVETQQIAEWLGLVEAINLDGGGSSNVWESNAGILNWPSNSTSSRVERIIPNLIVAKKK